jgi:hypothetical protein
MTGTWLLLLWLGDPSPVVFPEQQIPLTFSHRAHVARSIACDFCHEKAPESTSSRDFLVPPESACSDCHPIDRAKPEKVAKIPARCDACHPGWQGQGQPPRVVIPPPHLKFNHKIHVSGGMHCEQCHGDMKSVDLATRSQLPRMTQCLGCHTGGTKPPSRCGTCHILLPSGLLQTMFAEGKLAPSGAIRGDVHTPTFRREHAQVARNDERYCLNCHRKDECLTCHNGVVKPFDFHGNDYVSIHPIEARRDALKCQSCHRLQSFCLGCHQRSGVASDPPGGSPGVRVGRTGSPLRFHSDNWVVGSFRDNPEHHAWQAMRNIRACVSCHREQTCLECHSNFSDTRNLPSGFDRPISPHPPVGWVNSDRCRALVARNRRVCYKCHLASSPVYNCVSSDTP